MAEPGDPHAPTERLRRATLPFPQLEGISSVEDLFDLSRGLCCARCGQWTGSFTQGHYQNVCRHTMTEGPYHFCCPGDFPGCSLQAS